MKTHAAPFIPSLTALSLIALLAWPAHAGRPLVVDDANVNDPGAGQVEAWYGRLPGKTNTWNLAPAYAPIQGLEIGALLSRDTTAPATTTALQAKWRITPAQERGCNVGAVAGVSHTNNGGGNTPYLNGLATCNMDKGSLHLNVGANRAPGGPTLPTWGIAFEHPYSSATVHVEAFGQRHSKPGVQVGLRTDIAPGLQLDGSLGRQAGDTLFSVGVKKSF